MAYFGSEEGIISTIDGKVLIALYLVYFCYPLLIEIIDIWKSGKETTIDYDKTRINILASIFMIIIGAILLKYGGDLVVDESVEIAKMFGISERIIGLTIIAIGTALPELITSVVAVVQEEGRTSSRKSSRFMYIKCIFNNRCWGNNYTTKVCN